MSKSIISLVLLCFVAGEVFGLTTDGCRSSKECFSLPTNCIVPNCNVLVTWRYNSNNMTVFDFQAIASAVWVAFGLNSKKQMIGTQGVLCHKSGSGRVRAFDLTRKPPPASDYSSVIGGNTTVQINNGMLNCRYERDTNVANQRPLGQEWYLITAWGTTYDSNKDIPLYHGTGNTAMMSTKVKFPSKPSKPSKPSSSTYYSVSVGLMIASFSAILAQVLM